MQDELAIRFLGVGNAFAHALGNSGCVLEVEGAPALMVDCGPLALPSFDEHYAAPWPESVFVTHLHMDHIGGLEALFFRIFLARIENPHTSRGCQLFVPTHLLHTLHLKLAETSHTVAEGGMNWWDMFQLVPVASHFWLKGMKFDVFPVRHFAHNSAFGLCLPGAFLYTGDTRPIPEVISTYASQGELIFHDCDRVGSPAHCGADELEANYSRDQIARMRLYHYADTAAAKEMRAKGLAVVERGERFVLQPQKKRGGVSSPAPVAHNG